MLCQRLARAGKTPLTNLKLSRCLSGFFLRRHFNSTKSNLTNFDISDSHSNQRNNAINSEQKDLNSSLNHRQNHLYSSLRKLAICQRSISNDISLVKENILKDLDTVNEDLSSCSRYQFTNTSGKLIRPKVICCVARCINDCDSTRKNRTGILKSQLEVAKIAEMIHTASLIHDDVVDESRTRRFKPTIHSQWGSKKAVLTGDYILAVSSRLLAGLRHPDVIILLAQVIEDLVSGEFMQLKSIGNPLVSIDDYLGRIYLKTASLFANSCKACSLLAGMPASVSSAVYECGKNIGMAFQIVDDLLDFVGDGKQMGKSSKVDLKQGVYTLPVILALHKDEQLQSFISDAQSDQDFDRIVSLIAESEAIDETRLMARSYINKANATISSICAQSDYIILFEKYSDLVLDRIC